MTPVIVIRPEPGCSATVATAHSIGLDAEGFPLFTLMPLAWEPVDPATIDALLIGSASALRHGGQAIEHYRHLPVHVVGEATAAAARGAGFTVASTSVGGLQSVLDTIPLGTRLLRLAGAQRVDLTPPAGITITLRIVYDSQPQPMPDALCEVLGTPVVVVLHSGEAARHFAAECHRLGVERADIHLAAMAPRIAALAGSGWASSGVARSADETALLAIAEHLCQTLPDQTIPEVRG